MKSDFIKFILAIFIFSSSNTFSKEVDYAKVHEVTIKGIEELYSLRINKALNAFSQVITLAPNDPRGHFFKAMAHYYKYFLLGEETDYKNFMSSSDEVIEICERYLKYNNDAKMHFYLGGIKGYRGIIKTLNTQGTPPLSVLKEGKEAFSSLEKAIELNPQMYDAYMGLGLFTYIIGSLPKAFRWIASVIGYEGNKEKGLKYLELAYEKGLYSKYEALWWLTSFNMGEGNEEKASQYLTLILDKFPNNPIYLLQMGNFLLNQNNVDKALEYYNRSMAIDAGEMKKLAVYGNAGVARCFYLKNQFEKAIEKYELFLNSVSGKDDRFRNRDNAIYLLANAYEIIGEREKAVQYYSKVKYNDLSKLRLKQPLTQFQILAIKAYNTALSINFNEGVEQLKKFLSSKSLNADERAFSYYQLGLLYSSRKDYANSNLFFSKVLQEEVVVENYLKPYSTYYIGQNYLKLNDKSSAKKQFDKVKEFKDYYGEGSLKRLNNRALERL